MSIYSHVSPQRSNEVPSQKENILICDCGGGTVDITTYVITQVSPCLTFDELHIGAGNIFLLSNNSPFRTVR